MVVDEALRRPYFQLHSGLFLKSTNNRKKIRRVRVAIWVQHPMQALAGNSYDSCQFLEADGGINEVFQGGFPSCLVAGEIGVYGELRNLPKSKAI